MFYYILCELRDFFYARVDYLIDYRGKKELERIQKNRHKGGNKLATPML